MRLTYTGLKNNFLDGTGNSGSSDATLLAAFGRYLDQRYQTALAVMGNYTTQTQKTASTVAAQQYYHYPPGIVSIETATVTVGSIAYPLITVDSQLNFDRINQTLIATTVIPTFIFPRRDDFGIWPIPQSTYTITLNYHYRDRKLTNDDYTTGTVTITNGSQTVTGSGTTFTSAMIGRWFSVTNDGYWYRISGYTSATSITLESAYVGTSGSGLSYTIGESPELPEEAHRYLVDGAMSDYFSGPRGDIAKATWYNNVFWTGDGNNNKREGMEFEGGILGVKQRYAGRTDSALVNRRTNRISPNDKLWGTRIV